MINSSKYASVIGIRNNLHQLCEKKISSTTIYATLYRFIKANTVFDAGRGWYSTIQTPFTPQYDSVKEIVQQLGKNFPQLQFSLWSTEQLQPFTQHLLSQFTIFVYTETDAIGPITEFLQNQNHTVYPNPKQTEVEKYLTTSNNRIIVRPLVTEEPLMGHYAAIEKILIDLFIEKDRLFLIDGAEYKRILENLIFSNRINMGRLFRYSARRGLKSSIKKLLLGYKSEIIM